MTVHKLETGNLADIPALLRTLAEDCEKDGTSAVFTVRVRNGDTEVRAMGAGLDVFTTYTMISLALRKLADGICEEMSKL